jgi:hypothetical protein
MPSRGSFDLVGDSLKAQGWCLATFHLIFARQGHELSLAKTILMSPGSWVEVYIDLAPSFGGLRFEVRPT